MTRERTLGIALASLLAAAIGAAAALGLGRRRAAAPARLAHRADGSDDSASFAAQIADEGTIPDIRRERLAAST